MQFAIRTLIIGMAFVVAGCGGKRQSAVQVAQPEAKVVSFERDARSGVVRVLYVVLDRDGVYFGDHRTAYAQAVPVLEEFAKREASKSVMFHVIGDVPFGDAVRFYAAIDRTKYYVSPFPTIAAPPGYRLPLVGKFRKQGCCWIDEENHQELM
jgi:hypothetical protein